MTTQTPPTSPPPRHSTTTPRLLYVALIVSAMNAILAVVLIVLNADAGDGGLALWLLGTLSLATGLALFARALKAQLPPPMSLPTPPIMMPDVFVNQLLLRTNLESGKCACLAIGIDGFDHHTSAHGPNAAEAMLATVAGVFDTKLRASDIVGRTYDNTFVVVMSNIDLEGARLSAERIRAAAMNAPSATLANGQTLPVTVSIGLSLFAETDTLESLLDRAHHLLQTAQRHGVNTVRTG